MPPPPPHLVKRRMKLIKTVNSAIMCMYAFAFVSISSSMHSPLDTVNTICKFWISALLIAHHYVECMNLPIWWKYMNFQHCVLFPQDTAMRWVTSKVATLASLSIILHCLLDNITIDLQTLSNISKFHVTGTINMLQFNSRTLQ